MDIDGVAPIYTGCQKNFAEESENRTEKVIDCLWKGVKAIKIKENSSGSLCSGA